MAAVLVKLKWGMEVKGSSASSSSSLSSFHASPVSRWAHVGLAPRSTPSPSQLCFQVRADNNRPRRSVAQSASKSKKYYFTTESDEPSSSSPINTDSVPLLAGAAAAVGLAFVVYKYFNKNGWSLSMPKVHTGVEVGGAGAGSDKRFRRESMAKLNVFSQELRTFREVDLAGRGFGDEGFVYLAEGLAFNQKSADKHSEYFPSLPTTCLLPDTSRG